MECIIIRERKLHLDLGDLEKAQLCSLGCQVTFLSCRFLICDTEILMILRHYVEEHDGGDFPNNSWHL